MKVGNMIAVGLALAVPGYAWSEEKTPASKGSATETKKVEGKTRRKPKAAMCAECGKPEKECECGHSDTRKTTTPN